MFFMFFGPLAAFLCSVCNCLIHFGWSITKKKTSPSGLSFVFLCYYSSSTRHPLMSTMYCLYFPFLREWSQPVTTRSWIPKSRRSLGSASAKRKRNGEWLSLHHGSMSSQQGPQGALSSFMPRLASHALLLWRWQLGSQQHCSTPSVSAGCLHEFCYIMSLCTEGENNP